MLLGLLQSLIIGACSSSNLLFILIVYQAARSVLREQLLICKKRVNQVQKRHILIGQRRRIASNDAPFACLLVEHFNDVLIGWLKGWQLPNVPGYGLIPTVLRLTIVVQGGTPNLDASTGPRIHSMRLELAHFQFI